MIIGKTELEIFETLKEAFDTSTLNNNRFLEVLNSIKWDAQFTADCEFYFCLGSLTFTTPSLNPFEVTKDWEVCGQFTDGSLLFFH